EAFYFLSDLRDESAGLASFLDSSVTEVRDTFSTDALAAAVRLMRKYADIPMDFPDATLVLIAESSATHKILTLPHRRFSSFPLASHRRFKLLLDLCLFCWLVLRLASSKLRTCLAESLCYNFSPKMFAPSILGRVCPNAQRKLFNCSQPSTMNTPRCRAAFTLFELLIVVGIVALLMVLIAPAFTSIKSGSDFSSAVNGIRDVLENARTYAKANRTYVFVGLAEADSSVDSGVSPQVTTGATPYGRVAVAVVASKDGTRHFNYAT